MVKCIFFGLNFSGNDESNGEVGFSLFMGLVDCSGIYKSSGEMGFASASAFFFFLVLCFGLNLLCN